MTDDVPTAVSDALADSHTIERESGRGRWGRSCSVLVSAFAVLAGGFLGASCAPYGPSWQDVGDMAQVVAYLLPKPPPFIEQPVRLCDQEFTSRPGGSLVEVIAADSLSRRALEYILDEHVVLARFQVSGAHAKRPARAVAFVRSLGGDVLLTTHSSTLIGVIFKDVHYAGPQDGEEAMYALRRR